MQYKELLDEIRKIILNHAKPERIYLYGSRANGEATETSDIDIAYYDKEFKLSERFNRHDASSLILLTVFDY